MSNLEKNNFEPNNLREEDENDNNMVLVSNSDLQKVIEENLRLSQEILKISRYVKKYVFWQKIYGYLKLFIIIIPLVLAVLYLPPFLKQFSNSFGFLVNSLSVISDPGGLQEDVGN